LNYEELHNVYASTNVIRKIKEKRTKMVDIYQYARDVKCTHNID